MSRDNASDPEGGQAVAERPDPSHRRRFASDALWLIAGQLASALANLVGVRLLTEAIRPEVYGSVTLMSGILLLGRNLFCFPFYQAALRFFPEVNLRGEAWRLRGVLFSYLSRASSLLAALIVLVAGPLCLAMKESLWLVPIMVGLLYVDVFRTMETDFLNAARRQRPFSILRAAEAWARPLLAVLMVRFLGTNSLVVLFAYLVASGSVLASIFLLRVDRVGSDGPAVDPDVDGRSALRDGIWRFSLPLVPLAILEWISSLSDRYLIGGLSGLQATGIYVAAYGLVSQPFVISAGVLEMLFRPLFFEAEAAGDRARAWRVFRVWLGTCVAVCGLGLIAITILRDPITRLLLARQYRSAAHLLPWIAAGNAMFAVAMVLEKVFHAAHRTELVLVSRVVGATLSIAVGVPMILYKGPLGAALAVPIYYGGQFLVSLALVARLSRAGRRRALPNPAHGISLPPR